MRAFNLILKCGITPRYRLSQRSRRINRKTLGCFAKLFGHVFKMKGCLIILKHLLRRIKHPFARNTAAENRLTSRQSVLNLLRPNFHDETNYPVVQVARDINTPKKLPAVLHHPSIYQWRNLKRAARSRLLECLPENFSASVSIIHATAVSGRGWALRHHRAIKDHRLREREGHKRAASRRKSRGIREFIAGDVRVTNEKVESPPSRCCRLLFRGCERRSTKYLSLFKSRA